MKILEILILFMAIILLLSCHKKSPTEPAEKNIHPQVDIPWPSLADSPWPMHHHDPQSTGRSPHQGPVEGKVKWEFYTGARIGNSTAIGEDSTIYFGSAFENVNDKQTSFLYALNFDGSLKWKFETHNLPISDPKLSSAPLVARDGTIYVGSSDYQLYAVNPNGSLKWIFKADNRIRLAGMNIGLDGVIYFVDWDRYLYAVNPDGTQQWKIDGYHFFQEASIAGISISPDGSTLYLGFEGTAESDTVTGLAAVGIDGQVKWTYKTGAPYGTPLVDNSGNIFFGAGLGKITKDENQTGFFSLTPAGQLRWKYLCDYVSYDLTMDYNGNVFFPVTESNNEHWLVSLDNEGNLRWKYNTTHFGVITSSLVCDVEGTIYAAVWDKDLVFAVDSEGNFKWQVEIGPVSFVSPALAHGLLFVGTWYWFNKGKKFICIN